MTLLLANKAPTLSPVNVASVSISAISSGLSLVRAVPGSVKSLGDMLKCNGNTWAKMVGSSQWRASDKLKIDHARASDLIIHRSAVMQRVECPESVPCSLLPAPSECHLISDVAHENVLAEFLI